MNKRTYTLYLLTLCTAISLPLEAVDLRSWLANMYHRHYSSRSTAFKILAPITAVSLAGSAWWYSNYKAQQKETAENWALVKRQLQQNIKTHKAQEKRAIIRHKNVLTELIPKTKQIRERIERIEFEQCLAKEHELLPAKQLFLVDFNKHQTELTLPKDKPLSSRTPYTINLMWINRNLQLQQKYIFPSNNDEYVATALKWAQLNPESSVNLWLDSKLTPFNAIKNTSATIAEQKKEYPNAAPIFLKDIQDLSQVKEHPEVFSDKTPVYFRADLLRVIAGFETLSRAKKDSFVYADFDVEPMSQDELFDEQTQEYLKKYSMVMANTGYREYENSFYMLSNDVPNLLIALDRTLIELNIKRAYNALNGKFYNFLGRQPNGPLDPLTQIVYDSYLPMFEYFYHLQGLGILTIRYPTQKSYNYENDGLTPFGLNRLNLSLLFKPAADQSSLVDKREIWIPTKKVSAPEASLKYD